MHCPGCRKALPSQVKYCVYCGVGVSLLPPPLSPSPPRPRPKTLLVFVGALLLAVGVAGGWWGGQRLSTQPRLLEELQRLAAARQDLAQTQAKLQQDLARFQEQQQQLSKDKQALATERVQFETARAGDKPAEAGAGKAPPLSTPVSPSEKTWKNSLGMEFVLIAAGTFQMGSTDSGAVTVEKKPGHPVRLSKAFYLGKYEVTQGQWEAVMGNNPSGTKGDANLPVDAVSWDEVQEFIKRLNARESEGKYRLPTEAEWEYAARAGTTTAYSFGDDVSQLKDYAWYEENAGRDTHPVGQKRANPWGLYDMHGNVFEWVQDWYGPYTVGTAVDPTGPAWGSRRVIRGGSWFDVAGRCRSAYRGDAAPGYRLYLLGFRLVREVS